MVINKILLKILLLINNKTIPHAQIFSLIPCTSLKVNNQKPTYSEYFYITFYKMYQFKIIFTQFYDIKNTDLRLL